MVINVTSNVVIDCIVYSNRIIVAKKATGSMKRAILMGEYITRIAACENVIAPILKRNLRVSRATLHVSADYHKVLGNYAYSTYPGTKWCGTGTLALNASDLGSLKDVDACCHAHAHCSESMRPQERKNGLLNRDFYTRRHCRCDKQLFRCLKNLAPDEDADLVGHMYFNVLQIECFENDFPRKCSSFSDDGFCRTYDYAEKVKGKARYQWFSSPPFTHVSG